MDLHRSLLAPSLIALIAATSSLACSQPVDVESVDVAEAPIVGGTVSAPGAWPGAVALYKGSFQVCGGTLVADKWVITAGHCVNPAKVNGGIDRVVIGRQDLATTVGTAINVKTAFQHPGFDDNNNLDNDIALLELVSASSAPKARLVHAEEATEIVPNASVTVVGWGTTSQGGSTSKQLREVSVPIVSEAQCKTWYSQNPITENMICAGLPQGGKDSCQGDSGGPLFMKIGSEMVHIGVVSWGLGCARPNAPGVYTRVSNYLPWLSQTSGGAIVTATPTPVPDPKPAN